MRGPVRRSSKEKPPWKGLPSLEGIIESEFVRPVLLGENVLPYRLLPPREAVLPLEHGRLLDGAQSRIDLYPDLARWWRRAEKAWLDNRSSERLSLVEQLDFRGKLSIQLPASRLRVVYGASGMHVAASLVDDPLPLCDKALYWGAVNSPAEGSILCAILNSPALTRLVRPLMSYGKDERHIDKHVWNYPSRSTIPRTKPIRILQISVRVKPHWWRMLISMSKLTSSSCVVMSAKSLPRGHTRMRSRSW